ncbi:hypothetical protein ACFU9B_43535 [Streptomyces sp. NPDC057592]|uniref:hypothetical protein n=1 Tax=unclassified Streptomyces TaxID=2593676 RepID=UPI0036B574CD
MLDRWLADAGEKHPVAGWSRGAGPAAVGAALDAMEDVLDVLDRVGGDDPRWRAKRAEFAGLSIPGQLLQMRGEFVVARALAEAGVPYGLGDLRVSNPDFLLADGAGGAGGGGGPVAGVEVTAVSPKGIAELCELVESEGGLADVRVELEFTAHPSRLQDGAAGQILDAVRVQAAVLAGGQAGDAVVTVEDKKNVVPVTVTVRVRPGGGPLMWQVTGGKLEGPMASAEYAGAVRWLRALAGTAAYLAAAHMVPATAARTGRAIKPPDPTDSAPVTPHGQPGQRKTLIQGASQTRPSTPPTGRFSECASGALCCSKP